MRFLTSVNQIDKEIVSVRDYTANQRQGLLSVAPDGRLQLMQQFGILRRFEKMTEHFGAQLRL